MIRISKSKLLLVTVITVIFYNEWLNYYIHAWRWKKLPSANLRSSVRCLLVADAQILGEKFEPPGAIGLVTRWDGDRYLAKSFILALSHVKPDVVIFLGDNLDEGSVASREEFSRYTDRFQALFHMDSSIQKIFIPGDNDIGGEEDPVTTNKTRRYEEAFQKDVLINVKFVEFVKINRLAAVSSQNLSSLPNSSAEKTRILLSHIPILPLYNSFSEAVIKQFKPHFIFSAHEHRSVHFAADLSVGQKKEVQYHTSDMNQVLMYSYRESVTHEIIVPTCSYRMGVREMGYGAAVIEASGLIHYTILWLPSRFQYLYIYATVALLLSFLAIPACCYYLCRRLNRQQRRHKYYSV